jgi:hypothetical protein
MRSPVRYREVTMGTVRIATELAMRVHAVDQPELTPLEMPHRFKHDIAYFMTPAGEAGVPALGAGEYWVRLDDARRILDDGVLVLVSPLDGENQTEVEISEDQERWLEWMIEHQIQHVRIEA